MNMMAASLVIGYGNSERQDDGVAFYVVNRLRRRLAQQPLAWDEDGLSRLARRTDSVFIRQLAPELIEVLVHYDRVIFVDAHVPADSPNLRCTRLYPGAGVPVFSHHMHPEMLLGFLKAVYGSEPVSHLLTVQGRRFDLKRGLSVQAAALVDPAAEKILEMLDTDRPPCEYSWSDGVIE
jgi:hydrogenase maturation protease